MANQNLIPGMIGVKHASLFAIDYLIAIRVFIVIGLKRVRTFASTTFSATLLLRGITRVIPKLFPFLLPHKRDQGDS